MAHTYPTKQLSLSLLHPTPNVEHRILTQGLKFYSQFCQRIPAPVTAEYFDVYNLLYWSAKHTYHSIIEGKIHREGTDYQVIYKGMTRGELLQLIDRDLGHQQIALSFRKVVSDFDLPPVVLVSIAP